MFVDSISIYTVIYINLNYIVVMGDNSGKLVVMFY